MHPNGTLICSAVLQNLFTLYIRRGLKTDLSPFDVSYFIYIVHKIYTINLPDAVTLDGASRESL